MSNAPVQPACVNLPKKDNTMMHALRVQQPNIDSIYAQFFCTTLV